MNVWDIVDNVLKKEEAERERKAKDAWWPSEALGCRRRSYYDWTAVDGGVPRKPMDITGLYRTKAGNVLHEWFFKKVAEYHSAEKVEEEWSFRGPIEGLKNPISGRQDVRITFTNGGKVVVSDLKSSFGRGIRKIYQLGWQGISKHVLGQMVCYLAWGECDEVVLAYLGRDDQYRTQFSLTLNGEGRLYIDGNRTDVAVESVTRRWGEVEQYLEDGEVPPRDFMAAIRDGKIVRDFQRQNKKYESDWQCRFCPFSESCWAPELEKYKNGVNVEMFR